MPSVTPFLWFDDRAEEAARFYTSIFEDSAVEEPRDFGESAGSDRGRVTSVTFSLNGQRFIALNGGPHFTFSPAISLFVSCASQAEIDHYWDALSAGGEPQRCGWLRDKFGISWQVVPTVLGEFLSSDDDAVSERVREAMLAMTKLEIAGLEAAARDAQRGAPTPARGR